MNNGNGQQRQFTEVSGGSNNETWKPQATERNGMNQSGVNTSLQGYYSAEKEVTSAQKPFTVVTITTLNQDGSLGDDYDVIADTVLADRMAKVAMNSYVCLTYLGRALKKGIPPGSNWTQTNSYHNWSVGVDQNAIPLNQLMGKTNNQPNQQNQAAPINTNNMFNGNNNFQQGQGNMQQNPFGNGQNMAHGNNNFGQQNNGQPVQQGQPWVPPTQNNMQQNNGQGGNFQQQGQGNMQNGQNNQQGAGNVFGGNQFDNDDLPF